MKEENIRTAMLIGEENLNKLKNARILVLGLGGVGSYVTEALVRAGVGALTLVDGDTVSLSNINRQLYALHSTVGMLKTEVARQRVLDIDPDCKVNVFSEFITPDNIDRLFEAEYDFCADAIDDTWAKTAVAVKCKEKNVPLVAAMGTGCKTSSMEFRITDINKTEYCPLCRTMRKKYRDAGLDNVTVVYSPDPPQKPGEEFSFLAENGRIPPSSISFVPSRAGLLMAEYIVKELCDNELCYNAKPCSCSSLFEK